MNYNTIVVFDFETGSVDPQNTIPLSLGAKAYNPRSLKPIPDGEFYSLMRPANDAEYASIQDEALKVNNLKIEEIREAPDREQVWKRFAAFVNSHNKKGTPWFAPIAAGHNIKGFDLIIHQRLCQQYGMVDKEGRQTLFNRRDQFDLLDPCFMWFENSKEPANFKLDTLREFFGMSKENAHNAIQDVRDTGDILMRFLQLHRSFTGRVSFKNALSKEKVA